MEILTQLETSMRKPCCLFFANGVVGTRRRQRIDRNVLVRWTDQGSKSPSQERQIHWQDKLDCFSPSDRHFMAHCCTKIAS